LHESEGLVPYRKECFATTHFAFKNEIWNIDNYGRILTTSLMKMKKMIKTRTSSKRKRKKICVFKTSKE